MTIKSLAGGSYAGTANPSGAVAKASQSAITQPPTVIIQATGQSAQFGVTMQVYTGNLGGRSGADAKCALEFGNGWKFASYGRLIGSAVTVNITPWVDVTLSANGSCSAWTDGSAGGGAYFLSTVGNSSGYLWSYTSATCNASKSLLCTSM